VSAQFEIAVLVGSLRKESLTKRVARALIESAPSSLHCKLLEIGDLPLYNQDLDADPPAAWVRFRHEASSAAAVLFLTPEYNRSVPGCLKNAMDVGSRPEGKNMWAGKPAAVVSVTPYKLGAFGANHALRQSLVFLDMPVLQQPEAYIGDATQLFTGDSGIKSEETRRFFVKFMSVFAGWVAALAGRTVSVDFDAFMQRRAEAASTYVRGDSTLLDALVTRSEPATFFPPSGGCVAHAEKVAARYDKDAKAFSSDGVSRFEILQSGASGGVAFWAGFQLAEAKIGGQTAKMKLRVTEVFRLSDGEWKLVHRHADAEPEAKST
jgi:NAD(P)H-dependent FMN reductase/ketosteroid isomerase-like protein